MVASYTEDIEVSTLTILALPLTSDMAPTSTRGACSAVVLLDANSTVITVRINL